MARRPRYRVLRQLAAHGGGLAGMILVGLVVMAGLFAPVLTPYQPDAIEMDRSLEPPSLAHPLGTDVFGRDVATRLLYGARFSLVV
ncbi:MAG: ABC transporter permease, partial [Candidatus Krumholzibacteria bacterium]|nr:ABC transporter permease [Candidatus Krumholzibacteria bacterium]